jgi:sugar lactone lactonase YvrE
MDYYNSLVAGDENPGYQDGAFDQAQFNDPASLAFDDKGERLFVADRDNHRIRVIYLDQDNRVETVAGTDQAGSADGPLTQASFNQPSALAWVPGGQLVVYDDGNQRLRKIDFNTQTVSTLACDAPDCKTTQAPSGQVWNMIYHAKDNSLYFTQVMGQDLQKMDMGTQKVSPVFSKDPRLPQPKALCLDGDKLYVADRTLPTVYEVELPSTTGTAMAPPSLVEAGKGNQIQEMTFTDGTLYALQPGNCPLARLNPYEPVSLASPWGFTLDSADSNYNPLLGFQPDKPVGFVSCPSFPRKLFISFPGISNHSILSVKDYGFDKSWPSRDAASDDTKNILTDFHYPQIKEPRTFRILLVGDSQVLQGDLKGSGEAGPLYRSGESPRVFTFAKQLEFLLNTQASLAQAGTRYEVLVLAHPGRAAQYFSYYEAPPLIEKYDIDLVLFFITPYNVDNEDAYTHYFLYETTKEGLPAQEVEPEYLLTPAAKRVPPGVPEDLYQRASARGFIKRVSPNQDSFAPFGDLLESGDSQIRGDLLQMAALPLRLLSDKVRRHKTEGGKESSFLLCYAPSGDIPAKTKSDYHAFWRELSSHNQLPLLDLDDPFRALTPAFFPTNDACCHSHYTAYGNMLIATLLNYYLVTGKYIPFETMQAPTGSSQ